MSTVDKAWSDLIDGTGEPPNNPHIRKQMITRARNEARHPDEAARIGALKVLRILGGLDALSSAIAYAEDPSLEVRQRLVRMAVDAADDGRPVLRRMVADPDVILATEVIDRLIQLKDRSVTKRMRTLLQSKHTRIRHRAALFLGSLAGPSMVPFLARHHDEDPAVASAVHWAIAKLDGKTDDPPPKEGERWAGAPPVTPEPKTRPATLPPPEPPVANDEPAAVPADSSPALPAPPPTRTPVPAAPRQPGATTADRVVELFTKLAGTSEDAARTGLIAQIKSSDERALSEAFRSRRPGQESAASIGAALAAAHLGNTRWLAPIRKLATDPDPSVRAAVAQALGALCTPAAFTQLQRLASDSEPKVQLAGLPAMVQAALRLGYERQANQLLGELPKTEDEALTAARAAASKALAAQ